MERSVNRYLIHSQIILPHIPIPVALCWILFQEKLLGNEHGLLGSAEKFNSHSGATAPSGKIESIHDIDMLWLMQMHVNSLDRECSKMTKSSNAVHAKCYLIIMTDTFIMALCLLRKWESKEDFLLKLAWRNWGFSIMKNQLPYTNKSVCSKFQICICVLGKIESKLNHVMLSTKECMSVGKKRKMKGPQFSIPMQP